MTKVSVSIVTYNHEHFISQAIQSALMQKTNFEYEIIIGEDDSSDRTREIVQAYAARYPEKIRLFLNDRKNVIYVDGRPTGRWNFVNNLKHAQGQYVALLEGDDYWTDHKKLQKQVDFLDAHPECAVCFHNVTVFFEDGSRDPYNYCPADQEQISTLDDLLSRNFIPTCSVVFRRGLFGEFPEWFYKCKMGDWPLHILNAEHGSIGYIEDVMGVYRIHPQGAWSPQRQDPKLYIEAAIEMYEHVNAHLNYRYETLVKRRISKCHYDLAIGYASNGDLRKATTYTNRYVLQELFYNHEPSKHIVKLLLRVYLPPVYKLLKTLRRHVCGMSNT